MPQKMARAFIWSWTATPNSSTALISHLNFVEITCASFVVRVILIDIHASYMTVGAI